MWYVECEIIILNPNQSNELFHRTEIVPSVLIWPSSAQRELGEINKWHLFKIALQQKLSYTTAYNEIFKKCLKYQVRKCMFIFNLYTQLHYQLNTESIRTEFLPHKS